MPFPDFASLENDKTGEVIHVDVSEEGDRVIFPDQFLNEIRPSSRWAAGSRLQELASPAIRLYIKANDLKTLVNEGLLRGIMYGEGRLRSF